MASIRFGVLIFLITFLQNTVHLLAKATPDDLSLNILAPYNFSPHDSASDNSASDNSASDNSASDNSASDNSAPDNSAPDNSVPDNSTPEDLVSKDNDTSLSFLEGIWETKKFKMFSLPTKNKKSYKGRWVFKSLSDTTLHILHHTWDSDGNSEFASSGFLKKTPGKNNKVTLAVGQNINAISMEEGNIKGNVITLRSSKIILGNDQPNKQDIQKTKRKLKVGKDGNLKESFFASTPEEPSKLKKQYKAKYVKKET